MTPYELDEKSREIRGYIKSNPNHPTRYVLSALAMIIKHLSDVQADKAK